MNTIKIIEAYEHKMKNKIVKIKRGLKHILVFGQSRQGKSSVINMLVGLDKNTGAAVSDKIIGCTFESEPWMNDEYCFWDTAGLNEQNEGRLTNKDATKNLVSFIKQSKGFHAAIMVVNWTNINTITTKQNFDLFYNTFLSKKIPIIIVLTGRGIETSDEDDTWLSEQNNIFEQLKFNNEDGKCITCIAYSKDLNDIKNLTIKSVYESMRVKTIETINHLLKENVPDSFYNPLDHLTFFDILKKMWNTLMSFFGTTRWMITVRDAFKELLINLGFNDDEAEEISKESFLD